METDGSIDSRKKKLSPVIGEAEHSHHDTMLLDTLQLLKKESPRQPTLQSLVHDPAPCLMACVVIKNQYLHDVCRILT
jgi:hypothetical protein